MTANSPTHRVPDHELLLGGMPDETFYSEVLSAPMTTAEQMETTDSDCTSESDDGKVYMPLLPDSKFLGQSSSISQKLLPVGQINVHSWKTRHPRNWHSQDITNWIYFVCSQSEHIDRYKIRAENFNELRGEQLCTMTVEDFLKREPNYGKELYYCLQSLLKPANYKAPNDNIEMLQFDELSTQSQCNDSTMWSSTAMLPDQDLEMPLAKPVDLDFDSVGAGVAVIGDKKYDISCNDTFDDMPLFVESGYESGDSVSTSPLSDSFTSSINNVHGNTCNMTGLTPQLYPGQGQSVMAPSNSVFQPSQSYPGQMSTPKQRGRPKHSCHTPGQRGRKPGQSATKGNHLWKFIRDVINDSRYNPEVIRWEDRDQGIFRIVNSAEIARLWGEKKNNSSMTYEKFSRAMRYCRKQGDFGPLPKDQNLPKKLCFRFGSKKWMV